MPPDIRHVSRLGATFEDILRIPAKYLCAAEINDADLAVIRNLARDSMHHRKLCGEGQFDIHRFVACMRQAGYSGPFGVEVLSDELRRKSLVDAAESTFATANRYFQK